MSQLLSPKTLWNSVVPTDRVFHPDDVSAYPAVARRYLEHAIAPGTQLAAAVQLRMHGEIKLKGWVPFTGEEVLSWQRGLIWKATVWMNGLPIWGSDQLVDGEAALRWHLFGLFPVMTATGPEIARSGVGRMQGEAVWLPSVWCDRTLWADTDTTHTCATLTTLGETTKVMLQVGATGQLESCQFQRWGNPGNAEFGYQEFGGWVEQEASFGGYTIPTQLRLGWYFGSDRFESEGEFFRVTLDDVVYR